MALDRTSPACCQECGTATRLAKARDCQRNRLRDAISLSASPAADTDGRGLVLEPDPAGMRARDSGGPLLETSRRIFPSIQRVLATSG
jgi:hypothetical protein